MQVLGYFFSFQGRINRLQFLGGSAGLMLIGLCVVLLTGATLESREAFLRELFAPGQSLWTLVIVGVTFPLLFWTGFALQAKRLHDLDITAYWIITMIAVQILFEYFGNFGDTLSKGVGLGVFAWLIFMPGLGGRNEFGDAPAGATHRPRLADLETRGLAATGDDHRTSAGLMADAALLDEADATSAAPQTAVKAHAPMPPPPIPEPTAENRVFGRRKSQVEPAAVPLPADRVTG